MVIIAPILASIVAAVLLPTALASRVTKHANDVPNDNINRRYQSILEPRQPSIVPANQPTQPYTPLNELRPQGKSKVTKHPTKPKSPRTLVWKEEAPGMVLNGLPEKNPLTPYLCGGFPPEQEHKVTLIDGVTHTEKLTDFIGTGTFGPGSYPVISTFFVDDVEAMGKESAEQKRKLLDKLRESGRVRLRKWRASNKKLPTSGRMEDRRRSRGKQGQRRL